jgi:hypothetical protein
MKLGDIVRTQDELWKVTLHSSEHRTFTLVNWSGTKTEVPDTPTPEVQVVRSPQDWPFIALPMRHAKGRILSISRMGKQLTPLRDWVPSGMLSSGGSVFFSPSLRLRIGETLILHHKQGTSKANIKPSFMSVKNRIQLANKPFRPRRPKTTFDRLVDNNFDDLFDLED